MSFTAAMILCSLWSIMAFGLGWFWSGARVARKQFEVMLEQRNAAWDELGLLRGGVPAPTRVISTVVPESEVPERYRDAFNGLTQNGLP